MAIKYVKFGKKYKKLLLNVPIFSIQWPSKIYLNWNIWFKNIPSGNPAWNLRGAVVIASARGTEDPGSYPVKA
jgi:hypothetical protein